MPVSAKCQEEHQKLNQMDEKSQYREKSDLPNAQNEVILYLLEVLPRGGKAYPFK